MFVKLSTRAYKHETVAISSLPFLPLKADDSTIMGQRYCIAVFWSKMQAQKSLTLRWRSVDVHFQEVVAISLLAFLPRKVVNIIIMGVCHCTALELSRMHDEKLLTIGWNLFLEGASEMVVGPVVQIGGQHCHYGLMLSHTLVILQDSRPEICDPLLTLGSRMGQLACRLLL
jgi:hypothetical protein